MRGGTNPPHLLLFLLFLSLVSLGRGYGPNPEDNPFLDRNPPEMEMSPVGEMGCLDENRDFFSLSGRRFHVLLSCHTSYYIGLLAVVKSVWMNTKNTSQVRVWVLVEKNDAKLAIPLLRKELSGFVTDPEFVVFVEFDALQLPLKYFLSASTDEHMFELYEKVESEYEYRHRASWEEDSPSPSYFSSLPSFFNQFISFFSSSSPKGDSWDEAKRLRKERRASRKLLGLSAMNPIQGPYRSRKRFQLKKQKLAQPRTTSLSADIHNYLRYYLPLLFPSSLSHLRPTIITYLDTDLVVLDDITKLGKELERNLGKEMERGGGVRDGGEVKRRRRRERRGDVGRLDGGGKGVTIKMLRERRDQERREREEEERREREEEEERRNRGGEREGEGREMEEVCAAFVKREHPPLGKALSGLDSTTLIRTLSLSEQEATFNAGVMSVHIPCWERRKITDEIHFWMKFRQMRHIYSHGSQPPLLLTFRPGGRPYFPLERIWNTEALWGTAAERTNPSIVHWNGRFKPWENNTISDRAKVTRPIWEPYAVLYQLPAVFYEQKKPLLLMEWEKEMDEMKNVWWWSGLKVLGNRTITFLIAFLAFYLLHSTPASKASTKPK